MALKRKLSSTQLFESHQSTSSSTDEDEHEMPTRKKSRIDRFVELPCVDWSRTFSDQNSLQYNVCALEDYGQEPRSSYLEVLPPADQQVQTPSSPVHSQAHSHQWFEPVSEDSDSQERQWKKSSFGELLPLLSSGSGQGQKVEGHTIASISERHAEDEAKRTSFIVGRKRKQSSRSAQVYDSYQSTTSTSSADAPENHQAVGEENERPVRKRRRVDRLEKLPSLHYRDRSDSSEQDTTDQDALPYSDRAVEDHGLQDASSSGLETPPAPPVHHSPVSPAPGHNNRVYVTTEGNILSRYECGRMIGQGTFGSVFEGKRLEDGLEVAVKIVRMPPDMKYINVPGHPAPLPLEVGLLILANRGPKVPEIIELLDWQDQPAQYVMVFERPSPCQDLYNFWTGHHGIIKENTAQFIMEQVTRAAQMSCLRGVFHRDIKLQNLLINTKTLEVKLIDFGCGILLQDSEYKTFAGTLKYCPPEFYTEGRYHGEPATVWSLGVVLFLLVCGHFPEPRDKQMIEDDTWSKPGLSNECCLMIRSLLKKSPQQRICLRKILQHEWFKVTP